MRAKKVCVPKVGLSVLALHSQIQLSPEANFFGFGWGGSLALGGGSARPPPPGCQRPLSGELSRRCTPQRAQVSAAVGKPPHGLGVCIWMHRVNGTGNSPSPGRPTPVVVKQDKSSGGSVGTTTTRSDPQRVRMSSGERPIGTTEGKQPNTEALCQAPLPPASPPPPPVEKHIPVLCPMNFLLRAPSFLHWPRMHPPQGVGRPPAAGGPWPPVVAWPPSLVHSPAPFLVDPALGPGLS